MRKLLTPVRVWVQFVAVAREVEPSALGGHAVRLSDEVFDLDSFDLGSLGRDPKLGQERLPTRVEVFDPVRDIGQVARPSDRDGEGRVAVRGHQKSLLTPL